MLYTSVVPIVLALVASPVNAWFPGEHKEIYARDGSNLFNHTDSSKRWLQASGKIRGVNLGSMFVFEPWLASSEWAAMGCAPNGNAYNSEFDCVSALGQTQANSVFQAHWASWITQDDVTQMASYGLNTVRIPVGYWMMESIVYDSEHFPQGGIDALETVCGWLSDAGFYIIIDLHGAPGAQVSDNADTGQYAPTAGFYVDYQYARAEQFMGWIANLIHTTTAFRNVGMLGIANEPVQNSATVATMFSEYYPAAYSAIRAAESAANVAASSYLHVEPMNELWGSGDPTTAFSDNYFLAYDDHRYLKWDTSVAVSQASYLSNTCNDNRNSDNETPTVVGEFSLSVPDDVQDTADWDVNTQQAFYTQWFAAQVTKYEADTNGWVFWAWKSSLGDPRWSYQDAVSAGFIPTNVADVSQTACDGI